MTETREQFERRKKVLYEMICDKQYFPMKIKEIAIFLNVPREKRQDLKEVLDALIVDGKVELTSKGKYRKACRKFVEGTYIAHPKGYGFVEVEGRESDIFIPEDASGGAMHRDMVQVAILRNPEEGRSEGTVVKILEHGVHELIGTYQKAKSYGFVLPDNRRITSDIFVPQEFSKGAMDGHKVLVELTSYGEKGKNPEGKVKEIIGHVNDPGTDILSVVYEYELPNEFPEKVMRQAERTPEEVTEADCAGRKDLRDVLMVTIDGEDAKDLDDAVSLTKNGDFYELGVHIADVANYVQEKSALDREALHRGTSVYLADRVIPMLPHRLSNGICSLNAGVDRLALSCLMRLDQNGKIVDHEICESVICVNRRMSYSEVLGILETHQNGQAQNVQKHHEDKLQELQKEEELQKEYGDVLPMLLDMEQLMRMLRARRRKRGSIDFNFPEAKVVLDANGVPLEIKAYTANTATQIIEEFMLAANETVAQYFYWQEIPFLYRTHEAPEEEKLQKLASFIASFGYGMKGISDEIHPKELQKLLARIADTPEEMMISRLTLRSMKQARYTTEDVGHFGLAAPHYCHFTSPIRRYPDLQIHRIIKEVLRGRMNQAKTDHYQEILPQVAESCSKLERRADEAERETIKLKKAEYMMEHIGEEFYAVISGIMSYGMYAELPNTVEGLIHVSRMYDDRYYYREETYEMYGIDTGRVYRLGDTVRVRVLDADKTTKTVDFEMAL
ncbi:MAG: ribonuclease R [Lachnospiraceae bacterium]|jgi:ribonuclease R|nr:ribonuclease R [Lachnospiraceae bacterium]